MIVIMMRVFNVEPDANVTKLLTTRGSRNSNEPMNVDTDHISTMDTLEHLLHTLRVRQEEGSITKGECNRFESFVENRLDVLALMSEDASSTKELR